MKHLMLSIALLAIPAFAHAGGVSPQRAAIVKALKSQGVSIAGSRLKLTSQGGPVSPVASWSVKGFKAFKGTPGGDYVRASGTLRVERGNKIDVSIGDVKITGISPEL